MDMADTINSTGTNAQTMAGGMGTTDTGTTGATTKIDTTATPVVPVTATGSTDAAADNRGEAKSRFNSALQEAKAGAAALKAEAGQRAGSYRSQAQTKGDDYSAQAKVKASEYAVEGKTKLAEGISSLARMVNDNASSVDEKLGAKYGDYARSASRSLQESATKLEERSIDELGEDAKAFVRRSPGMAIGMATFAGYLIAKTFNSSRD